MPAALGVPGPGEIRRPSAPRAGASAAVRAVVALDADLRADLAQIVDQVPGEAVIIVDDEDGSHLLRSLRLSGLPDGVGPGLLDGRAEEAFASGADRVLVALGAGRLLDRPGELLRHLLGRRSVRPWPIARIASGLVLASPGVRCW